MKSYKRKLKSGVTDFVITWLVVPVVILVIVAAVLGLLF